MSQKAWTFTDRGEENTVFFLPFMDSEDVRLSLASDGIYPTNLVCIEDEVKTILASLKLESSQGIGLSDMGWPRVQFYITLTRNATLVHSTDYSMGIGHFSPTKKEALRAYRLTSNPVVSQIIDWKVTKPHVGSTDKLAEAQAAAVIANLRKFKPSLTDVLPCLLSDGSAYFDRSTFEEWAGDLGYDADSIKALDTYNACNKIGRVLSRNFNGQELECLREWAANQ